MSRPELASPSPHQVLAGLEARLVGPLRELLLLVKLRPTHRHLDYLLARIVREMYRGTDGPNWGMTQQAIADALGISRGRVQHILSQNLRSPEAPETLPELKLVLLTQLAASIEPLSHDTLFR